MAEIEFRDGTQWVPDHLADMMKGLDTFRMTREEATDEANKTLSKDYLQKAQTDAIAAHFKNWRTGE